MAPLFWVKRLLYKVLACSAQTGIFTWLSGPPAVGLSTGVSVYSFCWFRRKSHVLATDRRTFSYQAPSLKYSTAFSTDIFCIFNKKEYWKKNSGAYFFFKYLIVDYDFAPRSCENERKNHENGKNISNKIGWLVLENCFRHYRVQPNCFSMQFFLGQW